MDSRDTQEEVIESYKQAAVITKGTAVSLGVVVLIVVSVLFVMDIKSGSSANAGAISANKKDILILKQDAVRVQQVQNEILQDINTRLSRMEGILQEMKRGE